jgi:hypothetical protein
MLTVQELTSLPRHISSLDFSNTIWIVFLTPSVRVTYPVISVPQLTVLETEHELVRPSVILLLS